MRRRFGTIRERDIHQPNQPPYESKSLAYEYYSSVRQKSDVFLRCRLVDEEGRTKCANIVSLSGQCISWVTELRYLGIFLTCSRIFTCSTDVAKRSFYHSANAIFGKVGRIASKETVLELIKTKCIPAMMFGMEACPLKKRDINSQDFIFIMHLWS